MDVPYNYDENGIATDPEIRSEIEDQAGYIDLLKQVERRNGFSTLLSTTLADRANQDLAYAMKLYTEDGKFGFYIKVLDLHFPRKSIGEEERGDVLGGAGNSEGL